MSRRNQDGEKTPAPTIEEPPQSGPSRQLKLSRPAADQAENVQLDTCQLFLDSLEPVAWLLRKGTREVVACNKTAKELGITLGSTCYQSWAKSDTPCSWCQAPKVWKTGETIRYQTESDGRIWDAHWIPISDDLYLHYARDITEQKQMEEALLASTAKLQGYIDNAPDGVLVANRQGRFIEINPAVCKITGYTEKELLQLSVPQILGSESQEDCRRHFVTVVNKGAAHGEFVGLCKDGSKVHYIVDSVKVGEDRFMSFVKDISVRKAAELALLRQTHDLGERVKELSGLYGLSQLTASTDLSPEQVYQQAAELLPPAWHYPELTCGRIVVNQKEYTTDNYIDTVWKQSTTITVSGVSVGMIEVAYLKKMPPLYEGPFLLEERNLIDAMAQILGQYLERCQNESRLRESHTRLIEGQLALETKNDALSEVIEHVNREKKDTGFQIQSNIDRLVIPLLAKLETNASETQMHFLSMLRSTLGEIISPFVTKLERDWTSLTPREVEICSLIRNGLSSKDIAQSLHTSEATVRTQRKTIRKKLGLSKSKTNLATYLQQV